MNLYILTGTTKGLGAGLRDQLQADADNLVICISRAAQQLTAPVNIHLDVADIGAIEPAFAACLPLIAGKTFDRAVLINNAAVVAPVGRFDSIDAQELARSIAVNLTAPIILAGLFANATRGSAKQRLVVNISSGLARRAMAGQSAYCSGKAGLEMATRVAALEAEEGLAICSLAPGVIDTPMQEQLRSVSETQFPDVERFRGMKADGTLRSAADVARDIIGVIQAGKLTNGGIFDIREMTA